MSFKTHARALSGPLFFLLVACGGGTAPPPAEGTPRPSTVVASAQFGANVTCPHGGHTISVGIDDNGNGALDAGEVDGTYDICNGAPGAAGTTGLAALVATTPLAPGNDSCPQGGVHIESGIDLNGNGGLDATEVTAGSDVCNGAPGGLSAAVALTHLATGDVHCGFGGIRIDAGQDANTNGVLDPSEIQSTAYACHGTDGIDGTNGVDGVSAALRLVSLPVGDPTCPNGGVRVQAGLDANRNGSLDGTEVTSTQEICHGTDGIDGTNGFNTAARLTPEAPGTSCPAGGARLQVGQDTNRNGSLDPAEVQATHFVCNGLPGTDGSHAALRLSPELAGTNCTTGGTKIDAGIDANRNGTLDTAEISATRFVCNGLNGTNGTNGANGSHAIARVVNEGAGVNCATGGVRLDAGADTNGNGLLDAAEVNSTQFICNGGAGLTSLVRMVNEPAGAANCTHGGVRFDTGLDANRNGSLDTSEIVSTQYACAGPPGLQSLTRMAAFAGNQNGCTSGGVKVDAGFDDDRNGILADAEVDVTYFICHGQNAFTGINQGSPAVPFALVVEAAEDAIGTVAAGGTSYYRFSAAVANRYTIPIFAAESELALALFAGADFAGTPIAGVTCRQFQRGGLQLCTTPHLAAGTYGFTLRDVYAVANQVWLAADFGVDEGMMDAPLDLGLVGGAAGTVNHRGSLWSRVGGSSYRVAPLVNGPFTVTISNIASLPAAPADLFLSTTGFCDATRDAAGVPTTLRCVIAGIVGSPIEFMVSATAGAAFDVSVAAGESISQLMALSPYASALDGTATPTTGTRSDPQSRVLLRFVASGDSVTIRSSHEWTIYDDFPQSSAPFTIPGNDRPLSLDALVSGHTYYVELHPQPANPGWSVIVWDRTFRVGAPTPVALTLNGPAIRTSASQNGLAPSTYQFTARTDIGIAVTLANRIPMAEMFVEVFLPAAGFGLGNCFVPENSGATFSCGFALPPPFLGLPPVTVYEVRIAGQSSGSVFDLQAVQ